MGQSFGRGPSGRWVRSCDECGRSDGTVRRIRCPFGYCYPACLCRSCAAPGSALSIRLGARWAAPSYHRSIGCDARAAAAEARRQLERERGAAGVYFLHSAMSSDVVDPATGEVVVQVVFGAGPWGEPSPERWVLMRAPMYDAIRSGVGSERTPTLGDFMAAGPVYAGPVGYARDPAATAAVADAWRAAVDPVATAPVVGCPAQSSKEAVLPGVPA